MVAEILAFQESLLLRWRVLGKTASAHSCQCARAIQSACLGVCGKRQGSLSKAYDGKYLSFRKTVERRDSNRHQGRPRVVLVVGLGSTSHRRRRLSVLLRFQIDAWQSSGAGARCDSTPICRRMSFPAQPGLSASHVILPSIRAQNHTLSWVPKVNMALRMALLSVDRIVGLSTLPVTTPFIAGYVPVALLVVATTS